MKIVQILATFILLALIGGCSTKEVEVYNKPDIYWYEQIAKELKNQDLEKADDYYTSLSSEHVESPLLKEAMIVLANAHMQDEEYILANFYLDEYIKRYGNKENIEHARFLKLMANFNAFPNPNRNQQLLIDTIEQTKEFMKKYPTSKYRPIIDTMLVKMRLGEYFLDKNIAELYARTDKAKSAKIYKDKLKKSSLKDADMVEPDIPWYRSWFEK
ncbi:MAG: outer membrane protein assembly factor BamD [Sulfurospirillaceae bacterium]|nr:outer membrane protein assembly factor BamD [Sulfurospirillaceae bacterium]